MLDFSSATRLASLLKALYDLGYHFVTPTPVTHALVLRRASRREARSLMDVLGWSLPFREEILGAEVFTLLSEARILSRTNDGLWRSVIRVSSINGFLFLHSAFPTDARDAVFFGPDSYRFANAITAELAREGVGYGGHILDIGTGSGVGALVAAASCPGALITMTDINPKAMAFALINTQAAGVTAQGIVAPDLADVRGEIDLAMANPPYIVDPAGRAYRDGGDEHGAAVALDMTKMVLPRLAVGGRFLLYTGSAIIDGSDPLHAHLADIAAQASCSLRYREVDPDVFGEELSNSAYHDVDRIAVVVAIFTAGQG
ncbi:MAG TPA: class I SAM-dependent methyltransferase [Sphingobium sp.]